MTLSESEALFRQCSFLNNRAASLMTGGGAVKALPGSSATFMNCSFRNNSSPLRGGAIVVRGSDVTIQGGELVGNRTNLPNHQISSFGGAIVVIDGSLTVSGTRFDGNQAGWTGGAIYAIGNWDKGSTVSVSRSTFTGNLAVPDPRCVNPLPTSGGAIDAEDLTTLQIADSLFQRNGAALGGAVDGYRADARISGSVFQANDGAGGRHLHALRGLRRLLDRRRHDQPAARPAWRRPVRCSRAEPRPRRRSAAASWSTATATGCTATAGSPRTARWPTTAPRCRSWGSSSPAVTWRRPRTAASAAPWTAS